jgi:hypothetical protein
VKEYTTRYSPTLRDRLALFDVQFQPIRPVPGRHALDGFEYFTRSARLRARARCPRRCVSPAWCAYGRLALAGT